MSVRLKILAIAAILVFAFAATTALSVLLVRRVIGEMSGIVATHLPLSAVVAEIDVLTFEYELNARKLLDTEPANVAETARVKARLHAIAERLPAAFATSDKLVDQGVTDTRNDESDRLNLSKIDGALEHLGKSLPDFIALGRSVVSAWDRGARAEAVALSNGFEAYERDFGSDLGQVRESVALLTQHSLDETRSQSSGIRWINVGLFLVASAAGFALVAMLGYRLQQEFQRLLDGAKRIEEGELSVELPVTSRDEFGQLSTSFNRMVGQLRAKQNITDTFGTFVDPRIVARLLEKGGDGTPSASRQRGTVFFSDVKGFTSMSENLTADVIVRLLNAYFTAVTRIIRDSNGVVDKYIGDAVMAFWAPPFSPPDQHAADACLAALAQQAALNEFRLELSDLTGLRRNVPDFRVRMGLATGDLVLGTVGSTTTKSYTAIGDTVNVASRLEVANKEYGTAVLVTGETLDAAADVVEAREIDMLLVAGKTEPIRVFELLGRAGAVPPQVRALSETFALGLDAYRQRQWDAADVAFVECLRLSPNDGPATTFRHRVAALRRTQPPEEWSGVWALTKS